MNDLHFIFMYSIGLGCYGVMIQAEGVTFLIAVCLFVEVVAISSFLDLVKEADNVVP